MEHLQTLTRIVHSACELDETYRLPTDPRLWYNRRPDLLQQEQLSMAAVCPNALLGILQTNGSLYWLVDVEFSGSTHKFMLLYQNSFPENTGSQPSISVIPLVPKLDQLRTKLNEDCLLYYRRDETLRADCIWLYPGHYQIATAADYLQELVRWLAANQRGN